MVREYPESRGGDVNDGGTRPHKRADLPRSRAAPAKRIDVDSITTKCRAGVWHRSIYLGPGNNFAATSCPEAMVPTLLWGGVGPDDLITGGPGGPRNDGERLRCEPDARLPGHCSGPAILQPSCQIN